MADLRNARVIYVKGFLFLFAGILAAGLLIFDRPTVRTASLVLISVRCFARFDYFAFYVIEHYVDAKYHFAGLGSFLAHMLRQDKRDSRG